MGDTNYRRITSNSLTPRSQIKALNNYVQNGLTYMSDNTRIHPRDEAGNIIFNDGVNDNPILIVEPVRKLYTVESVVNVLKTNFEYFKFPVSIDIEDDTESLESLNTEFEEISLQENDPIYARYKPNQDVDLTASARGTGRFIGTDFDEVVEGVAQQDVNFYTVTKQIKDSGKDLRFRIKIAHSTPKYRDGEYFGNYIGGRGGYIYWSVGKSGVETYDTLNNRHYGDGREGGIWWASNGDNSDEIRVAASNLIAPAQQVIKKACEHFNNYNARYPFNKATADKFGRSWNGRDLTAEQITILDDVFHILLDSGLRWNRYYDESVGRGKRFSTSLGPFEKLEMKSFIRVIETKTNALNVLYSQYKAQKSSNYWGRIETGEVQNLHIDFTLLNEQFDAGDRFNITYLTENIGGHTLLGEQSYFVVTDASKNVDTWNREL